MSLFTADRVRASSVARPVYSLVSLLLQKPKTWRGRDHPRISHQMTSSPPLFIQNVEVE